jgi:hypothetical protein
MGFVLHDEETMFYRLQQLCFACIIHYVLRHMLSFFADFKAIANLAALTISSRLNDVAPSKLLFLPVATDPITRSSSFTLKVTSRPSGTSSAMSAQASLVSMWRWRNLSGRTPNPGS